MSYDDFKLETLQSERVVNKALDMRIIDEQFADGFAKGMYEAREIFMRLEDAKKTHND